MFAKIFAQIFDSSIAENYEVRHCFQDLLILADSDGVVDMTLEAVSRRTNVPLDMVKASIEELMKPDTRSRSKQHDGRRLVPVDPNRDWGWLIVNYRHYRDVLNEEGRRKYFRDAQRRHREKAEKPKRTRAQVRARYDGMEKRFMEAHGNGDGETCDKIAGEGL